MVFTRKKNRVGKLGLLNRLAEGIVLMEISTVREAAFAILEAEIEAYEAIERGLLKGMERAGKLYEQRKYFIPELLMCSDAMYAGLEVLSSHIRSEKLRDRPKIVLGVVKGDIHQIGKDLVKIVLEASGCDVVDLGYDVSQEHFVSKVLETKAKVVALSASMSTSLIHMKSTIEVLKKEVQHRIRVMVGGGVVTESFAKAIGADAYGKNAFEARCLLVNLLRTG